MKSTKISILLSFTLLACSFFYQGCETTTPGGYSKWQTTDVNFRSALHQGDVRIGMTWDEVVGVIGRPSGLDTVRNAASSSGTRRIWTTQRNPINGDQYRLVFVDNEFVSWEQI
jgi:hypothetical protein